MPLDPRIEVRPNSLAIVWWDDGGAGQIHSWIERELGLHVACFVHPFDEQPDLDPEEALAGRSATQFDIPHHGAFKGLPLISSANWPARLREMDIARALILIPDKQLRSEQIDFAREAGLTLINALHPTTLIMADAILGQNIVAHARVFLGYRAEVGDGVVLNTGVQIEHHTVVERCVTIDPAVVTNGNVTIRARAHINPGAIITKRRIIGEDAIVAAGAVVIEDVPPRTMVAGVPARRIRSW